MQPATALEDASCQSALNVKSKETRRAVFVRQRQINGYAGVMTDGDGWVELTSHSTLDGSLRIRSFSTQRLIAMLVVIRTYTAQFRLQFSSVPAERLVRC